MRSAVPLGALLAALLGLAGCAKPFSSQIGPEGAMANVPSATPPKMAQVDPAPTPDAPAEPLPDASDLREGVRQNDAYLVAIGVGKYRDVPGIEGAADDAKRFAAMAERSLGVKSDNVMVLTDDRATASDFKRAMKWLQTNVPEDGKIYFYFSGHGSPDPGSKSAYLVPYDGDPAFLTTTSFALDSVMDELHKSKAASVVAVLDSCFSGAGGRSVLPKGARPLAIIEAPKAPADTVVLSAAAGDEIAGPGSGSGGLFTQVVIEALGSGNADVDGNGKISAKELHEWVGPRVQREAKRAGRKQNPMLTAGGNASKLYVAPGYR